MFGQTWPQGFLFCQDVHVAEQTFGKISVEVVGTYVLAAQCSRQVGFSFAMAGRASNSLSKQEYEKIVRANKVSVLKADLSLTLDELASKYAGLLKDLLDKTARVSKNSLCEALLAANESNDPQDPKHFAGRIVEAVSAGRQLAKSMTSGKKTSVGLKVVVDALKKWSSCRTPSRSPDSMPIEQNFDKESSQPRAVPTLPTSSASSSKRLSREEVAKSLGLTSEVSCGLEAASASPASVHGSSSEETPVPASASAVTPLAATYWVDSTKPALCRKFPGHAVQVATMHPGDHGFAVAKFSANGGQPAEEKQTEIPNLLLHEKIVGKKPATNVKKRPAAVLEAAPEAASEHSEQSLEAASVHSDKGVAAPAATPVDMGYSIMTYTATGAVAIRETKLGKRQLFQIRNPKKSIAQLKAILEKAKKKLLQGEPAEQVKLWAKEQAGQ